MKCGEKSLYSLVTNVRRSDGSAGESYDQIDLPFDIPHKHMIPGKNKEVRFLVQTKNPFVLIVTPLRGAVWY